MIFEFYPKLSESWSLYNRFQALYNYNMGDKAHDRSYIYVRLGMSYRKFRFGAGTNIDYYGPQRLNNVSFGVFIGTLLF